MLKQSKQSFDNIDFLQDITPEAAAAYSGGLNTARGTILGGGVSRSEFNPDVVFYTGPNQTGQGYMVRAATGEGLSNLVQAPTESPGGLVTAAEPNGFKANDNFESVEIIRGQWLVTTDVNYRGRKGLARNIGKGDFAPGYDNSISSLARVG